VTVFVELFVWCFVKFFYVLVMVDGRAGRVDWLTNRIREQRELEVSEARRREKEEARQSKRT